MPRDTKMPGGEGEDPFDLWLTRALHAEFDSIAEEPIPEDLLRLIETDRAEREAMRARRQRGPGATPPRALPPGEEG